jgi:hypothetical protein
MEKRRSAKGYNLKSLQKQEMPRRKSQTLPIIVLICLVVGVILLRYLRKSGPPEINCGVHCGTERWQIKTVSDADAPRINWTPEHTSVSSLVALPAPATLDDARADAEKKLYSVEAVLLGWKAETGQHGDRDFHLVLADPADLSRTMIAEVPSTDCVAACNSSQAQHFIQARQVLVERLTAPQAHFRRFDPAWVVRVQGVGFFDIFHGQIGVAENCIELHPVVQIEFVRQLGPELALPRRIEPPANHHCGRFSRSSAGEEE